MSTGIVHVVLAKWRADIPNGAVAELEALVDELVGIPGVVSVACGTSVSPEGLEDGFDWALVVRFADAAARDAYLPHPLHAPVAALIGEWNERIAVFDVLGGAA